MTKPYMDNQDALDNQQLWAIFGGTFDPIHCGHLTLAEKLVEELNLKKVVFMPNHIPPHRPQPIADAQQRLAMLRLAIANNDLFQINDHELQHDSPSYTVETLHNLRASIGFQQPLAFIIGQDSLLNLPRWYRWQSLLNYCHLLVCPRPNYASHIDDLALRDWLRKHQTQHRQSLHQQANGLIYQAQTPMLTLSASEIRQRISAGRSCEGLVPASVQHYIEQHHLYR